MLPSIVSVSDPKQLSPLALAFVGDAVYELLVRSHLTEGGTLPPNLLHKKAVQQVCAGAQSEAYEWLEPLLNEEELAVLKRGRNAHSATVPRRGDAQSYRRATGVEALFGYLYLKGELKRVEQLFSIIEERRNATWQESQL